jgi:hypothetical protein
MEIHVVRVDPEPPLCAREPRWPPVLENAVVATCRRTTVGHYRHAPCGWKTLPSTAAPRSINVRVGRALPRSHSTAVRPPISGRASEGAHGGAVALLRSLDWSSIISVQCSEEETRDWNCGLGFASLRASLVLFLREYRAAVGCKAIAAVD